MEVQSVTGILMPELNLANFQVEHLRNFLPMCKNLVILSKTDFAK